MPPASLMLNVDAAAATPSVHAQTRARRTNFYAGGSGRPHAYPRSACLHADPGASAGGLRLSAGNRARLRQLQCGVCWLGRLVWRWL